MKGIKFGASNKVFTAPNGMNDCASLHVHFDGKESISCWRLSLIDIVRVLIHRKIWLYVRGVGHPPVGFSTKSPFVKERLS